MKSITKGRAVAVAVVFGLGLGVWQSLHNEVKAQSKQQAAGVPQLKYDPFWPKPLPEGWVLGSVGSVCVDAQDHVFAVTRGQPDLKEHNLATPAPPVLARV